MSFVALLGISGAPTDGNLMQWNAVIFGPHDTPFEDGTFRLTLAFTGEGYFNFIYSSGT